MVRQFRVLRVGRHVVRRVGGGRNGSICSAGANAFCSCGCRILGRDRGIGDDGGHGCVVGWPGRDVLGGAGRL